MLYDTGGKDHFWAHPSRGGRDTACPLCLRLHLHLQFSTRGLIEPINQQREQTALQQGEVDPPRCLSWQISERYLTDRCV